MHRTHHLVDPSFDIRSPACAAPTHTVDNSGLQALMAKRSVVPTPCEQPSSDLGESVEYFYEAIMANVSHHIRFTAGAGGTD